MLVKSLLQIASPAGRRARLSVLIFHRVAAQPDPIFPDEMHARRFDEMCSWLKSWFNLLPLDTAVTHLKAGTLPARAACITFDDGYADNFHTALPIIQRHGLTATFFIATGFLDGGRMWNDTIVETIRTCGSPNLDLSSLGLGRHSVVSIEDKRVAISSLINAIKYKPLDERVTITEGIAVLARVQPPENLMMTSGQVKCMRKAGMQIGAHTRSHPILARLTDEQARQEIQSSKDFLESLLEERIGLFAYPNGKPGEDYSPQSVAVVRSIGFEAAVSTNWGASSQVDDLFQIRRFSPWDRNKLNFGVRLAQNLWCR